MLEIIQVNIIYQMDLGMVYDSTLKRIDTTNDSYFFNNSSSFYT